MCVALAAAILAAFLVVVLGTPTKPAEAAFPGTNGKIAFVSHAGDPEILTMNANGDNKSKLTNNQVEDLDPAFSANGRKIAFTSGKTSGPSRHADIFTMSATGTDKKRVTRSEGMDLDPAWSPDGTRIAFSTTRNGNRDIYVINKDGTGLTRLTTSLGADISPAWSPDGTRIAFESHFKIHVMKAARESATNIPQRLTTSGTNVSEHDPAWSPNGTRIAFESDQSGPAFDDFELYSIRADGSDLIRLTTTFNQPERDPAWSPDGTKIAFERKRGSDSTFGIFVMKAAPESATNRPKLISGNQVDSDSPDWQPLP
jgi:Tol biopolymer transport system component